MTITLKSNPDGTSGAIQVNGNDAIAFGSQGITQGAPFSFRNKIINGKMEIAQRGTSFPAISANTYSLDRWICGYSTTAVATISQHVDAPSYEFLNSLRAAVTTADTSIAAGEFFQISQFLEGYTSRDLIGRTFTLSFLVRSSKTGVHCVSFRNNANDRAYVAEYTVNAANTWEYKTVTITGGLTVSGTWLDQNNLGLRVTWALAAGSTFQTTAGAWQTGNFLATSNQVNCLDTAGNIFAITGVQLEAGSVATPFEHRPIGTELALCQRYCQVIRGVAYTRFGSGVVGAGNAGWAISCTTKVPMRAAPTISQANCTVTDSSGNYAVTGLNNFSSADIICFDATIGTSSMTPGRAIVFGDGGSANAVLTASAEL